MTGNLKIRIFLKVNPNVRMKYNQTSFFLFCCGSLNISYLGNLRFIYYGSNKKNEMIFVFIFLFFFQFLCEMAMAWQMTVDKKLGIFAEDKPRPDPLAKTEDQSLDPNPPMVAGHQIWTKVGRYPPFLFLIHPGQIKNLLFLEVGTKTVVLNLIPICF